MQKNLPFLIFATALNLTAQAQQNDALESIERFRGGRHWVEAKTLPPKSPDESLTCLRIEPGFRLELAAAEPIVKDPVAICFDERGRMFVVEYGDYPTGPEKGGAALSRVVLLEDGDGDGRMDTRKVFADKLDFAHSLMAFKGGILVGAKTQIVLLRDTDGDDRADIREVLFDGFVPAHPQMQIGNPRWGLDNWIHLNYGPGKIKSVQGKTLSMPSADFRFHPNTMEYGPETGLGQYGNTINCWGERFFCTNRNPIIAAILSPAALKRNPFIALSGSYDVAPSGGAALVYPLIEMKSNYLSHAGSHTSACGTTAYHGDQFGASFLNSVFVCEPIGHLVTRTVVRQQGVRLVGTRARAKADFIASTDTWFRPSSLANAPDGCLYLADMYRLWVEHPKFLPPEVAAKLDWRAGEDRGRIYRIVPKEHSARPYTAPENAADLLRYLNHGNGWHRFLAQRLIVEKQSKELARDLKKLLRESSNVFGRLHSLWTLDGLDCLDQEDLLAAMNDSDEHLRADAVSLAASRPDSTELFDMTVQLGEDPAASVRFQVALALGKTESTKATEKLARLAERDSEDSWFAKAILSSAKERSGSIVEYLIGKANYGDRSAAAKSAFLRDLASVIGVRGDLGELKVLFATIANHQPQGAWWQAALVNGLGRGLSRHRGSLGRTSLAKLLSNPPAPLTGSADEIRELLDANQSVALDRSRSVEDRVAAIELLSFQPFDQSQPAYARLISNGEPINVQIAAIGSLSASGNPAGAEIVLERWLELGPTARGPALRFLLRRADSTSLTLTAMDAGKIGPSALSIDDRARLLKHSNATIRQLAEKLFGGAVSPKRREVAKSYHSALALKASSEKGAAVFEKSCAKCHKINGKGYEVGPDLSDVRNRSREAILYDILDPNSKVEPRFTSYTITTLDGQVLTGLIVSETAEAVVIRQAENKEETVGRGDIEQIRDSGVSLMPEGVEKEVTVQQMADLIAFLKSKS